MNVLSHEDWQERNCPAQLTIGELISIIKALPPDVLIESINHPHSYRGYYDNLALQLDDATVAHSHPTEVIEQLKHCLQTSFTGYKGGTYRMFESTPVWVSDYSKVSDLAVVGVEIEGNKASFIVRHIP